MSHLYSLISLPVSLLDLLLETLLENDVTVRPVITAPPDTDTPLPSPGLVTEVTLSNLVLPTTPSTLSVTRSAVKKYHRRRKEKRFGRGFRLNRNKERR